MIKSFASKVIGGFSKVIGFLGDTFSSLFEFFGKLFNVLFDFFEKPLTYIIYFFEAIFYFFERLFTVAILVIKIFVALFQFVGALIMGIFRTIKLWLGIGVTPNTSFPSASRQGFDAVIEIVGGTGLMTVVPMVALAFLWFYFVIKMIGLFGGNISISPFGGNK